MRWLNGWLPMIDISYSVQFRRTYKRWVKNHPDKPLLFTEKILLFSKDPFNKSLATHKLVGKLKGAWAFSLEYDLRVLFTFTTDTEVIIEDIGTHDEVY